MEAKLAEYRARKAKETGRQSSLISNLLRRNKTDVNADSPQSTSEPQNDKISAAVSAKDDQQQPQPEEDPGKEVSEPKVWDKLAILEFGLKCLLWLALWGLFVEIQFGAIFVLLSALYFLYQSLSNRKRKKNKLSAYSVFNPNFERLDGTFTAEQFEQELRYGPSAVR